MLNLKKLNLALCLSVILVSGASFATEIENKSVEAVDVLTLIESKGVTQESLTYVALGCAATISVCQNVAGEYGYPYFLAQRDSRCNAYYPYACYGGY